MSSLSTAQVHLRSHRSLRWFATPLAVIALLAFAHVPILRGIASLLIVEDSLKPAAAIVALGGHTPFREMEAAHLYNAGWAPRVVIVPGAEREEAMAINQLGIAVKQPWETSREVLVKQGVPPAAITVSKDKAEGTLEELRAAYDAIPNKDTQVILVTSKFHTRRTRLTWNYVTSGQSQAIVRAASGDPFDPTRWWQERRFILSVVREYLGLINYYAGFPVTP